MMLDFIPVSSAILLCEGYESMISGEMVEFKPMFSLRLWQSLLAQPQLLRNGNNFLQSYQPTSWVLVQHQISCLPLRQLHYIDVITTTMGSRFTSLTVVYSIVYSDADQRKHQSSASLAFVLGIRRDRWIPRTKDQLRGKCFHLMTSSCNESVKESKMTCCHTKEQLHNYIIKHGFDAINTHELCVCLWKSKYLQSLQNHVYVIVI